jgi:hypothetical protein
MSEDGAARRPETVMTADLDFRTLDDDALLSSRARMRAELERLPPESPIHTALTALYDQSTQEVDDRARRAWAQAGKAS